MGGGVDLDVGSGPSLGPSHGRSREHRSACTSRSGKSKHRGIRRGDGVLQGKAISYCGHEMEEFSVLSNLLVANLVRVRVQDACAHVQECQRIGSVDCSLDARMGMHVNFKSDERITWSFSVQLGSDSHNIVFLMGDCVAVHPQVGRSSMPDDGQERRGDTGSTKLVDS